MDVKPRRLPLHLKAEFHGANAPSRFFKAIENNETDIIRQMIAQHPADWRSWRTKPSASPVAFAAQTSAVTNETLALLLSKGGDPNDFSDFTPLHLAMLHQNAAKLETLLSYHANPDMLSTQGYSPLHSAIMSGNTVAADLMIICGADPNVKCKNGKSAYDYAGDKRGMTELIEDALARVAAAKLELKSATLASQEPFTPSRRSRIVPRTGL